MSDKRETGRAAMQEILGSAYMERRDASTNDFNAPLRRLSEEMAFGDVWQRPGLERKWRSLLCLAMLTALNRPHEIAIHVTSAINNGATPEDIREVLLHSVPYCGLPAAIDATKVAEDTLRQAGHIS